MSVTATQRKRLRKKVLGRDDPYVRCSDCGWVGFDVSDQRYSIEDPEWKHVTGCPSCAGEEAVYALSLEEWNKIRRR